MGPRDGHEVTIPLMGEGDCTAKPYHSIPVFGLCIPDLAPPASAPSLFYAFWAK